MFAATILGGVLLAGARAAHADPVTYSGTLGSAAIVVEFTDDPAATGAQPSARYFYVAHGIDIPLHGKAGKGGAFLLDEEEACGAEACSDGKAAPVAATWQLTAEDGGARLEGTWTGKKALPVSLKRVASRPQPGDLPKTPYGLYAFSGETFYPDGEPITMEVSPYDVLRLDVPLDYSETQGWPDASYNYAVDPRTKFPMPRIVTLKGSVEMAGAQALLQQRHWQTSRWALSCAALRYRGFFEEDPFEVMDDGSLAGFDESQSEVLFLSPRLMSWSESGSVYCGGAYPHNYYDRLTMDIAGGRLLGLGDMFADVTDGVPGATLVGFVADLRDKPTLPHEIEFETECGTEDLIRSNLAAHLRRDGDATILVFGLAGLPHVIAACADDLLEIPAEEAKALFTPEFAKLVER